MNTNMAKFRRFSKIFLSRALDESSFSIGSVRYFADCGLTLKKGVQS